MDEGGGSQPEASYAAAAATVAVVGVCLVLLERRPATGLHHHCGSNSPQWHRLIFGVTRRSLEVHPRAVSRSSRRWSLLPDTDVLMGRAGREEREGLFPTTPLPLSLCERTMDVQPGLTCLSSERASNRIEILGLEN